MAATGKPLAELAAVMDRLPQVLVNVRGVDRARRRRLRAAAGGGRAPPRPSWATTGRVLLRPSGTEPLVRVMVEAPDKAQADAVAARLAAVVKAELATLTYSLRSLTRRTAWSGPFSSTRVARPRVGRMFCTRFGSLTSAQIDSAVSRAASSDSAA